MLLPSMLMMWMRLRIRASLLSCSSMSEVISSMLHCCSCPGYMYSFSTSSSISSRESSSSLDLDAVSSLDLEAVSLNSLSMNSPSGSGSAGRLSAILGLFGDGSSGCGPARLRSVR